MPDSPIVISGKYEEVENAWATLRSTKSFANMTLTQFRAPILPSKTARGKIKDLEDQMTAALDQRDIADVASLKAVALVVNAVKGDPAEGEDGELYEAMGYVRKSERKSGKTNKKPATP